MEKHTKIKGTPSGKKGRPCIRRSSLDMKSRPVDNLHTALVVEEALKPLTLKVPGGSSGEEPLANWSPE
eukprot:4141544-Heterocapsa_arctica.AAC.1